MSWWRSEHGTIGDSVAGVLDGALERIEDIYLREAGRQPSQGELADLIEFCTTGMLVPTCGNPAAPYSKSLKDDDEAPRVQPRGRQGALWDASAPPDERMADVDPATGNYLPAPPGLLAEEEL